VLLEQRLTKSQQRLEQRLASRWIVLCDTSGRADLGGELIQVRQRRRHECSLAAKLAALHEPAAV
jgi:hypothetical protein